MLCEHMLVHGRLDPQLINAPKLHFLESRIATSTPLGGNTHSLLQESYDVALSLLATEPSAFLSNYKGISSIDCMNEHLAL